MFIIIIIIVIINSFNKRLTGATSQQCKRTCEEKLCRLQTET